MSEIQDANNRFNTLWQEIGAKRIIIGDEDQGIEIVIDDDLSIFSILEKLKNESDAIHNEGGLSSHGVDAVHKAADAIKETLHSDEHKKLGDHFRKFFHKN